MRPLDSRDSIVQAETPPRSLPTQPQPVSQRALRSRGTLLPRPARYLLAPPMKSLGFGNWSSLTNLKRESLTMYRPVCPPVVRLPMMPVPGGLETFLVGLGLVEPPPPLAERTKLLGSSREERMAGGMLERTDAVEDV